MQFEVRQVSAMEKLRANMPCTPKEIHHQTVLRGERVSYQLSLCADTQVTAMVCVESALSDHVRLYAVKNAVVDLPCKETNMEGEDYLTLEPGMMPDILVPISSQNNQIAVGDTAVSLWVKVDVPEDMEPGKYAVKLHLCADDGNCSIQMTQTMTLNVIPVIKPEQKLIYTRWFYADCIAVQHNVEIFSEKHWFLMEQYIAAAADVGINMILVPVHTPPLDTQIGTTRPCVQLVDIEKVGENYRFGFDKFHRFIEICKKHGIRYYEIAHMFSQWGAKCAPNILVTENGKTDYLFGWHVSANSDAYVGFLKQYIAAISKALEEEGISEQTYFHISDEPSLESIQTYQTASDLIRPMIGNSKTFDALSNYAFYEKGLVECPVTSIVRIQEFLEHEVPDQWVYYCCHPEKVFTNSFLAMPSSRVRILGILLYKYDIKGFLHWGFNFYNAALSRYPINPYLTTSADGAFASGDGFIVYPGRDEVYPSIRGEMTYEAIQDMDICRALEACIGKAAVVELIDQKAGFDVTFDHYPRGAAYLEDLRAEMVEKIRLHTQHS